MCILRKSPVTVSICHKLSVFFADPASVLSHMVFADSFPIPLFLMRSKAAFAHLLCRKVGATSVPAGELQHFMHETAYVQTSKNDI